MVKPKDPQRITLTDLKKCQNGGYFFNALMNVQKFLDSERQFSMGDKEGYDSDWDRFASQEYDRTIEADESNENVS